MSFRLLQLSPQASARVIRMRVIPEPWSSPSVYSRELDFVKSWFEHDESSAEGRTNWGAISGLALAVLVSASFWMGVALVVQRVWK